ncbi:Lactose permease [Colletotrichum sp. SAR 10_99]|nr:Lactose permease [Colletotrichum sp. SAR 10_99]
MRLLTWFWQITAFLAVHPGGKAVLLKNAGKDSSDAFDSFHPVEIIDEYLKKDQIVGSFTAEQMEKTSDSEGSSNGSSESASQGLDPAVPPVSQILSISEMEHYAMKKLSPKAISYYASGTDDEVTKVGNGTIFRSILLRPRVFVDCTRCSLSTTILGNKVGMPIYVSPAAMAKLAHPVGEAGIAAACSKFQALQIISKNASMSPSAIVKAGPDATFAWQLYVLKDIEATERTLAQIRAIPQIKFIVLTLDAPFPGKREADERFKMAEVAGGAPPQVWGTESGLTWKKILEWLSKHTSLPIVLKGIQTHEDAYAATLFPSVKGIIISNHGGRALDTTMTPVQVLLEIRKFCPQVFDKIDVLIDGGVKRGTDVVKALALGAKGVGIGRAALYSLAVGGQAGVERALQILADETVTAMRLLGVERVDQLNPRHLSMMDRDRAKDDAVLKHIDDVDTGADTYATIMATQKPDPRGPGYMKLYLLASMVFLCSTMNGFDSSLMGSINALPNYTAYFGLPSNGNTSTGIVFAIFQVGQMCGALFIWMADCLPMFIGGRFILSFAATCAHTSAPLYLVEISPAAYRGTIAGMYNTFYNVGSILATSAVYACHLHLGDKRDLDWRIPLWLQMVCPGLVCLLIKFFPESPRWLVAKDRHDEAKNIIATYHTNGDLDHPLVDLQMKEMINSVDPAHVPSWRDLFDLRVLVETRSSRYRLMLNVAFSWFGQFSGNNIISYYLPIMLSGVGITDTNTKLILNIVYSVIGWVFSTAGSRLHDVVGRRKMLITTTAGMTVCLAIVAGCSAGYTDYGNTTASTVSIVFIFVFGAVFSAGFTPMQPIYPAEVVSNKMRAKAMGTFKLTAGAAGFLNTFVGPIALSSIGYWFYVFFVAWDSFEIAFMYFFFVETKGFTLEELDEIFEAKNPRDASLQAKKRQTQIMREGAGPA